MRENMGLYRGKRVDNGEWVEGFYHRVTNNWTHENIHCITCFQDMPLTGETILTVQCEVDPDTVGECTGLRDTNGKLIFEGDIISAHFRSNRSRQVFKVRFGDGMFLFDNGYVAVPSYNIYRLKVIGNIHDNPELLDGGADNG